MTQHVCGGSAMRGAVPNIKSHNVITDEDVNHKAEEFNNFFAGRGRETFEKWKKNDFTNTYTASDNVKPLRSNDNLITHNFSKRKPVDVETVTPTLSKLKETESVGSDDMSFRSIKDSLIVAAFYLTCITNTSIVTGKFSAPWKHACLVPIFKGGDNSTTSNYWPISRLSILSKVLEKFVAKQLSDHLEGNALLSITQHGFMV